MFIQKIVKVKVILLSVMFLKQNPLPYLARFPGADVLTSSDQVIPTVVDDRLDIGQQGEVCVKSRSCYCRFFLFLLQDS